MAMINWQVMMKKNYIKKISLMFSIFFILILFIAVSVEVSLALTCVQPWCNPGRGGGCDTRILNCICSGSLPSCESTTETCNFIDCPSGENCECIACGALDEPCCPSCDGSLTCQGGTCKQAAPECIETGKYCSFGAQIWMGYSNCPDVMIEDCGATGEDCSGGECVPSSSSTSTTTSGGGSTTTSGGGTTTSTTTVGGTLPIGVHDSSYCAASYGWACDEDDWNHDVVVHFYSDGPAGGGGTYRGSYTADDFGEAAIGPNCGGDKDRRFNWNTPAALKDGQPHTIYVYAINYPSGSNPTLVNTPKTIQINPEICNDGIDNDCDNAIDCADTADCLGQIGPTGELCCINAGGCVQDDCVIESCISNVCNYVNRAICADAECAAGRYCDSAGGDCTDPDIDELVCINCASDTTPATWTGTDHQDAGLTWSYNTIIVNTLYDSDGADCPGGGCYDKTSTGINVPHETALPAGNRRCCGNDANEYYKSDYYGGECTNNVNECVWGPGQGGGSGDAQRSGSGNGDWWCYLHEWHECLVDDDIGMHINSPNDVICAGNSGDPDWTPKDEVLPENQYSCVDGIDNDGDGDIDCDDSDCDGVIQGNVQSSEGSNIHFAKIDVLKGVTLEYVGITNPNGDYNINPVSCGTYNLVASATGFVSQTRTNVVVPPTTTITVNFIGTSALVPGTTCEADCTYAEGNTIHKECAGINGCVFYKEAGDDTLAKKACDLAQPNWERVYDIDNMIVCAPGPLKPKTASKAKVTCTGDTLVKVTIITIYKGKPVRLIISACE